MIILDNIIPLTAVCTAANWHLATVIDLLIKKGIDRPDAEAFADFAFDRKSGGNGSLTDKQKNRITED